MAEQVTYSSVAINESIQLHYNCFPLSITFLLSKLREKQQDCVNESLIPIWQMDLYFKPTFIADMKNFYWHAWPAHHFLNTSIFTLS